MSVRLVLPTLLSTLRGGSRALLPLLAVVLHLATKPLVAQDIPLGFSFLNIPATAQSVATGGLSLTHIEENGGIAFDNPALYGEETAGRLFMSYMYYMQGAHHANVLYGLPLGERGAWAVGIRALNYGKLQGYDLNNLPTGSFSATDIAVEGLYSYELTNQLRGGIALKLLYSHIERYNALALAADLGVSYYNSLHGVSLGVAVTNVGATLLSFDKSRPMLTAWDIRLGYSQQFRHAPLALHFTAYGLNPLAIRDASSTDRRMIARVLRHFAFGVTWRPLKSFWLAAGYNPRLAQDLQVFGGNAASGLSLGAGFSARHFHISLAVARYHPATLSLMATFSTTFGDERFIF